MIDCGKNRLFGWVLIVSAVNSTRLLGAPVPESIPPTPNYVCVTSDLNCVAQVAAQHLVLYQKKDGPIGCTKNDFLATPDDGTNVVDDATGVPEQPCK
ncbi:MAG TPA: hypothetical protein VE954_38735 [Oligoflexus sp.]|uniref:hypothetical protein n=1 Tax=Oligoflexus sp. TaxID=1971216 RepID=UPI002D673FA7|nr:hypothetical protein [Oligoflexus sp.]HYX39078.1 hypothetical protein [Oligoflexus sp.]